VIRRAVDRSDIHPWRRAWSATPPIATANPPKTACSGSGPTNGICTSTSISIDADATRTAVGAAGDRRAARTAAAVAGTVTVAASHTPGSTHDVSPSGSRSATGGAAVPVTSMTVPIRPLAATTDSTPKISRRCG
jgi:hypothetical protein